MDNISKFGLSKEVEDAINKAIDNAVEIGRKAGYEQGFKDGEQKGWDDRIEYEYKRNRLLGKI